MKLKEEYIDDLDEVQYNSHSEDSVSSQNDSNSDFDN